jgi:hypothetical protein
MTDWEQMRQQWLQGSITKGRNEMPDKACATCKNFRQNSASATGDGLCSVIKTGEQNKVVFDNTDASGCPQFLEMERMRTDTSEFMWDPEFRPQRQLHEK